MNANRDNVVSLVVKVLIPLESRWGFSAENQMVEIGCGVCSGRNRMGYVQW